MPTVLSDLGNGNGYIYETDLDGNIIAVRSNNLWGLRDMRQSSAVVSPIAASRSGYSVIKFTAAPSGNVTSVSVSAVNQIGGNVAATGATDTTAEAVAAAINAYAPGSGPDFTAYSLGDSVYMIEPESVAGQFNGVTPGVAVDDISITTVISAFKDGASPSGAWDGQMGTRFYLDSNVDAPEDSIAAAIEISKQFIVRSYSSGTPTIDDTVISDRITPVDRYAAITHYRIDTESMGATDYLVTINPVGMVEGDILMIAGQSDSRATTIVSQPNAASVSSTANPNIYLINDIDFVTDGPLGSTLILKYTYTDALGAHWVEITRSAGGGGGGACVIVVSYAEAAALIASAALQQGCKYLITDALSGEAPVLVAAASPIGFEADAEGIFMNADFQGVGDYSGVSGFNSAIGIWYDTMGAPTAGDVAIYNNYHYKNLLGAVGSAPSGDTTNWELQGKALTTGYIQETDRIIYDFDNDIAIQRADRRGNVVTYGSSGASSIVYFPWGSNSIKNNTINNSNVDIRNCRATFTDNKILSGSHCTGNNFGTSLITGNHVEGSSFFSDNVIVGVMLYNNVIGASTLQSNNFSNGFLNIISRNELSGGAYLYANDASGGNDCIISENRLFGGGALIRQNDLGSGTKIVGNFLMGNSSDWYASYSVPTSSYDIGEPKLYASIQNNVLNGFSRIANNVIKTGARIYSNTLDTEVSIYNNELSEGGVNGCVVNDHIGNNIIGVGLSSVTISADIYQKSQTAQRNEISYASIGVGTIDIDSVSVIPIPANQMQQFGIWPLTSTNATETVDSCTPANMNNKYCRIRFQPESGLAVTFTMTAAGAATTGQFVGPAASYVVDGSSKDYIEFENILGILYYVNSRIE